MAKHDQSEIYNVITLSKSMSGLVLPLLYMGIVGLTFWIIVCTVDLGIMC